MLAIRVRRPIGRHNVAKQPLMFINCPPQDGEIELLSNKAVEFEPSIVTPMSSPVPHTRLRN